MVITDRLLRGIVWFGLGIACVPSLCAAPTVNPKYAGAWIENQSKRQIGSPAPLRFRETNGQLEELRGPVEKPLVQAVKFGTPAYAIDGSKNTIEWKKKDETHFERRIYQSGKLLATRHIEISADGKTMTEVTERSPADIDTLTLKRTSGTKGLAGTWSATSFKNNSPARLTIEVSAAGLKTTDDRGVVQTLNFDGKPTEVRGPAVISGTMVAASLKDANTIEVSQSREGVATGAGSLALSADGKMLTATTKANAADKPSVIVYDRK